MRQNRILELGLLIPILTVITITAVYSYEYGYFSYFGIPTDYIEIELTKSSLVFFAFIPILLMLYSVFLVFSVPLILIKHFKKAYSKIILFLLFIACLYFLLPGLVELVFHKRIGLFFFSLMIGIVLLPLGKNDDEVLFLLPSLFPAIKQYSYQISKTIGATLIFTSLVCIIMFAAGHASGQLKSPYYTRNNNKTILLRKYSSLEIYGLADSSEITFRAFIITSGTNNDTIRLRK